MTSPLAWHEDFNLLLSNQNSPKQKRFFIGNLATTLLYFNKIYYLK